MTRIGPLGVLIVLNLSACFSSGSKHDRNDGDGGLFDESDSDTDTDTDSDTDSDSDSDSDPSFEVYWGSHEVSLFANDCPQCAYFGMAEDYDDCDSPDYCWSGEDCVYGYYVESTDQTLLYCHPISESGGSWSYGGSATNLQDDSDTVFPDSSYSGHVTYFIESGDGNCYVGGADPDYYNGLGCSTVDIPD